MYTEKIQEIKEVRDKYLGRMTSLDQQVKNIAHTEERLNEILEAGKTNLELYEETRNFFEVVSEEVRKRVTKTLEEVVTMCVNFVFGNEYSFKIVPDTKRSATVVDFFIIDNSGPDEVVLPPESNFGGGMIDTISIGLRFGLLKVLNDPPSTPIILDEPAKMVSEDRILAIAKLIKELATIFDRQVIMVTHSDKLMDMADNSIYIEKINGVSKIKEERKNE